MSYRGYSGYDPNYSGYKASNAPPIIPVSREEVLANCSQQSYPVPPTATGYQEWELPFSPCADCRGLQLPAKTDSWRIPVSEMATPETFLAYIDLPGTVSDLYAREGASREILDDLTSKAQESALNSYYQTYPRGGQAYYQNSPQYSGDSEHGYVTLSPPAHSYSRSRRVSAGGSGVRYIDVGFSRMPRGQGSGRRNRWF